MHKKILSLVVIFICSTFALLAQTITDGGYYYLRNRQTGKFLTGGNNWGTQASLHETGIDFELTQLSNGNYTIKSNVGTKNSIYLSPDGVSGFLDKASIGYVFENVEGSFYVFSKDGTANYLTSNNDDTRANFNGSDKSSPYAQWELLTKQDLIDGLSAASSANPMNATFLIPGFDFNRNDSRNGKWEGGPVCGGYNDYRQCAEKWNTNFDVYQELTGLPNGLYKLSVQGFYRAGNIGSTSTEQNAFLYANGVKTPLMNINTEYIASVPIDKTSACDAFVNGLYRDNSIFVNVTDGKLRVGIRKETLIAADWACFDNFHLTYYGNNVTISNPYTGTGKFYLQNVATNEYLQGGAFNGLQAMLGNGIEFELVKKYDGIYHIRNVGINPEGNDYLSDERRLDDQPIDFIITETYEGSKVYNIATQSGFLLTSVAGNSNNGERYKDLNDFTLDEWDGVTPGSTFKQSWTGVYANSLHPKYYSNQVYSKGALVYGTNDVNGNVHPDLTGYTTMTIKGTSGSRLRVLFNCEGGANSGAPRKEEVITIGESGYYTIDLTPYGYFHLNAIKVPYVEGATATIESITLDKFDVVDANLGTVQFALWSQAAPGGTRTQLNPQYFYNNVGKTITANNLVYGDAGVWPLNYADLTGYKSIRIKATPEAKLRFLFNREGTNDGESSKGSFVEKIVTIESDGYGFLDLSEYSYVHLNAIKTANDSKDAYIEEIALSRKNNSVMFLANINDGRSQWRFVTEAERIADLAGATRVTPKDATFLIKNASLTEIDNRPNEVEASPFWTSKSHWYYIQRDETSHTDGAGGIVKSNNGSDEVYQSIPNLPNGLYELSIQGCYSNFDNAMFYANGIAVALDEAGSEFETCINADHSDCSCRKVLSAQTYGTNNYKKTLQVIVTNGTLRIGVRGAQMDANKNFLLFDNFRLTYLGQVPTDVVMPITAFEGSTFGPVYMKNVSEGTYLTAGGSDGVTAVLGDSMYQHSYYPETDEYKQGVRETDFTFVAVADGKWKIKTGFGNDGYLVRENGKARLNGAYDESKALFELRCIGGNYYIVHVSPDGTNRFLRHSSASGFGWGKTNDENQAPGVGFKWTLQTKYELMAEFPKASPPIDATFLLRGTAFHKDDSRNSDWKGVQTVGGAQNNYVANVNDRTFDVSQRITGVPNGVYEYTLQGYYITADGTINTNARYYVSTDGMSFIARNTNDMPAVINGKNYTSATQPTLVWQQDFTTGNIIPEIGKDYGVAISDKVYNVGADIGTITINGIAINSNFGLQIKTTWLQRYTDKGQKGLYSQNDGYSSIGIANLKAGQIIRIKTSDTDAFSAANNVVQLDMTLANDGEVTFRAIKDGNGGISVKRYTYIYNVAVYNEVSSSTDVNISNIADAATLIANENGTHPVIRFKVENGTIILGAFNIMKAENTSLYMDNVRLTYLGPDATGYGTPIDIEQGIMHKPSRYYDLAEQDGNLTLNRTTFKASNNKTTMSDDAMVKHPYTGKWIQHTPQYEETIYAMAGQDLKIVMPNSYTSEAQSSAKFYQRFYNFKTDGLLTENAATNGTFSFNNDATVRKEMRVYEGVAAAPAGGWLFGNRWNNQMVSKFNFKTPTTFTDTIMIGVDHSDFTDIGDMGMFGNLTEPTLVQRIVYNIVPASQMVDKLNSCTDDKYLEVKSISFPTIWHGQNMNKNDLNAVALDMQLKNYFTDANKVPAAKDFTISLDDGGTGITLATTKFSGNTDRFIKFNYPDSGVVKNYKKTAYIYVKSGGKNIAKFILDFVPNTELRPWKDIIGKDTMRRSPIYMEEHAIPMEQLNFDRNYNNLATVRNTWPVGDVTAINGIEEDRYVSSYDQFNPYPLDFDQTSFAAYYPNAIWGQYSVMKSVRIPSWTDVRSFKDINQLYHDHYTQLGNVVQTEKYKGDGYFMYIDASNFPSSVATLNINEELCDGTTIHFSGWVSAMAASTSTSDAPGYLLFSIVGKKSDGTQETIESFCPGPIRADAMDYNGTRVTADTYNNDIWGNASRSIWQQFAFSFVIKSEVANKYSSYALKIDNYCSNTTGGDMMVDDVRLYIQKAVPDIMQTAPICNPNGANDFKVYTTFEQLLDAVNKEEATSGGETAYAWYTFIDNSIYAANLNRGTAKAFEAARIKTIGDNGYFKFTFSTHYDSNDGSAFNAKKEDILSPDGTTERRINLNPNISYGDQEHVLNTLPYYLDGSSGSETPGWVTGIDTETIYGDGFEVNCNRYTDLSSYDELRIYQVSGAPVRCFFYNERGDAFVTVKPEVKRNNYWVININDILNTYKQAKLIAIKGNASGVKANVSNIIAYKRGLEPNKQYQIVFHATTDNIESISDPKTFFNLESQECASMAMFDIISGNITRFDGINSTDDNNFCEGQIATIKVEMQGVVDNTTVQKENLFYDWWAGDKESLTTKPEGKDYSAWDVLNAFRTKYPEAEAYNGEDFVYKEDLLNLLAPKGKLHLYKTALNVKVEKSENSQMKVTVIPLQSQVISFDGYCDEPSEIVLNVNSKAPTALDGFKKATYPDYMQEVPLRIGLEQIKEVTADASNEKALFIPLRQVALSGTGGYSTISVQKKSDAENFAAVYLAETNDPEMISYNKVNDNLEMRYVGKMHKIVNSATSNNYEDYVQLTFNSDFKPKEGYRYTLKTSFIEQDASSNTNTCNGDLLIPMYIVPEYQVWTGGAGNNDWTNDRNWRRADNSELNNGETKYTDAGRLTNKQNTTSNGLVPMNFTNVLMQTADGTGNTYSSLSVIKAKSDGILDLTSSITHTTDIEYHLAADRQKPTVTGWSPNDNQVYCVPFYTNTCDEINFAPSSQMLNTHLLKYNKAWVEYALESDRWYALSSPLQGVVSGDMYLPRNTAKQNTAYFYDINYDNTNYSRLKPAVYQQAWDKAEATIYRLERDQLINMTPPQLESNTATANVARAFNWSKEYNDVKVPFGINGFSVRVDDKEEGKRDVLLRLPKADNTYNYYMGDDETNGSKTADLTTLRNNAGKLFTDNIDKDGNMTVTLTNNSNDNEYYLVGNPFMSALDLDKFFDNNPSLDRTYWILTSSSYTTGVKVETQNWLSTDVASTGDIAPLQAFFVRKTDDKGGELSVKFTKDMAVAATGDALVTRSTASHTPTLRITAMRNGMTSSALVACRDNANSGFKHGEDAEALFDSHLADAPTVFTMSGDKAAAINVRKSLNGVPLGIESNDDSAVSLTFNGVENFSEELYLYDLLEDKSTPIISSGSTVSISGKTVGRYYLVTSDLSGGSIATTPVISIDGKSVSIVSPAEDMTSITVNDVAGRRVYSDVNVGNSTKFELHQGIYIINVETAKQQVKEKILIK